MSKKLAMNTTVEGETYEAGTVPPAEIAKKIDNAKAWGEEPQAAAEPEPEPTPDPEPEPEKPADPQPGPRPSAPRK